MFIQQGSQGTTADDIAPTLDPIFINTLTEMHDTKFEHSRLFFRLLGTDAVIRDAAITRDAQTERWLVQRLTELLPATDGLELLVRAGSGPGLPGAVG